MGNSSASLMGSKRRLPPTERERVEYVKNVNADDDSDYDDELDSKIMDDAPPDSGRIQRPNIRDKDGKDMQKMFDDPIEDLDNIEDNVK